MDKRAQTIQFFLPHGEPRGIRIAQITMRMVEAVFVPRSQLTQAADREELRRVGVYFLVGEPEDAAKPVVYVGEAEDCYARLKQHNATKDFWQHAIAIVSKTNSFTKAHAKYLEWYCIQTVKEVRRYTLDNGNAGGEPHVTEPMLADIMEAFEALNVLTSALGDPIVEAQPTEQAEEVFYLKGKEHEARGQMVDDGFMVLAGSKARKELLPSASDWAKSIRQKLTANGILQDTGEYLEFTESYNFKTPSGAAVAVYSGNANGWQHWKTKGGKTLDEVKRKPSRGG